MDAGVGMEADQVGAGFGEGLGQRIHRLHHQVHVDRHLAAVGTHGMLAQRLADHRAEGQVRHVVVVHHVEVDPVGAGVDDGAHVLAEAREVGRQQAGGDAIGRHGGRGEWRNDSRWPAYNAGR
jgi:hypothetical protein